MEPRTILVTGIQPKLAAHPKDFFIPQFANAEAVECMITNLKNADLNAPEWNWCGICCTRMILLALGREAPPRLDMYRCAFKKHHAYREKEGRVIGAYHKELATYIEQEFQLRSRTERGLTLTRLIELISEGAFVIASVSAEIRHLIGTPPNTKSGHFVLVYGIRFTGEEHEPEIILHNSAGFLRLKTQSHVHVPATRFLECFSGNGILVQP